jgi:hypothetical protein
MGDLVARATLCNTSSSFFSTSLTNSALLSSVWAVAANASRQPATSSAPAAAPTAGNDEEDLRSSAASAWTLISGLALLEGLALPLEGVVAAVSSSESMASVPHFSTCPRDHRQEAQPPKGFKKHFWIETSMILFIIVLSSAIISRL